MDGGSGARGRGILTLPNVITSVRLLCVPLLVVLVSHAHQRFAAAVLFAVLGATDWVDGFLARRLGQVSTVGKVLDPVADRVVLLAGVGASVAVGAVPVVIAVLTLVREGLVATGTLAVAAAGGRRIDVQWVGKAGTFGLLFAFPLFLVGHSSAGWHSAAEALAWCAAVPALILGWYAAAGYVPMARRAVIEGRAARRAAAGPLRWEEVGR